jgi:hypothetical protein
MRRAYEAVWLDAFGTCLPSTCVSSCDFCWAWKWHDACSLAPTYESSISLAARVSYR